MATGTLIPGAVIAQLCSAYASLESEDMTANNLAQLLRDGDLAKARTLLDAAELRNGSWFAIPGSENQVKTLSLATCHALILISEESLDAAKFFFKRVGQLPPALLGCKQIYERLWVGDGIGALELANGALKGGELIDLPLARMALEQTCARLRARELQQMRRTYTALPVAAFGRAMGLATPTEVEAFCKWSPDLFECKDGFVVPTPPSDQHAEDLVGHIEQLTRLVVFLESKVVTHVDSRIKSAPGTVSSQSQ